jgi:hypothetical protein
VKGLGTVLSQQGDDDSEEYVIAYASRTLEKREAKWHITELEALGIIWALKLFRHYIYERQFTILTDHRALEFLDNVKDLSGRLARWAFKIQAYKPNMKIEYKKGRLNANADALSRLPVNLIMVNDEVQK